MDIKHIIAKRRDGLGNSEEELKFLANAAAGGRVPDYQLSAWLMAAYFKPLTLTETISLTLAMADSGARLNLTGLPKPWVDKHSTGGVGDKTSIVLLPLLASCGLTIVKMSGRGLGITGGTVDKLESVPGFRMDLTPDELIRQAAAIGLAITGQTADLAPADKVLYALRDVTETVDSLPLIVSSILSKKVAGGAERVIMDVKCGSGGFMTDLAKAESLAHALIETGKGVGLPVHVAISDMSQPLGRMVGNLLEVKEAAWVLRGGQGRFTDLCVRLAGHALVASGKSDGEEAARETALSSFASGRALSKAREWFSAQGATVDVFDSPEKLACAPVKLSINHQGPSAYVKRVDARAVGEAVMTLGGGREKKTDRIDPAVGVECLKQVGDQLRSGEALFIVHAADEAAANAARVTLLAGFEASPKPVATPPLVCKIVN